MARSRTVRGTRLGHALCVVLSLAGCHATPRPPDVAARAPELDRSAARQVDWLPAEASAVLHFDIAQLRTTRLYRELAELLPTEPPVREVLERTDSLRVGVVSSAAEPEIVMLFAGTYDAHVNPSVLAGDSLEPRELNGARVLEHMRSHDLWFRTPEDFWICSEQGLFSHVFSPPETRPARLGARGFARAPHSKVLFHGALALPPLWREQLAQDLTDPVSAAMFRPAVEELTVLTFEVESDGAGGYVLELSADFASSRGAQSAAFVVQAAILTAKARAEETAASAPEQPPRPQGDAAFELGKSLGTSFANLLDELVLEVQGTRVSASLILAEDVLEQLRTDMREAAARAARARSLGQP